MAAGDPVQLLVFAAEGAARPPPAALRADEYADNGAEHNLVLQQREAAAPLHSWLLYDGERGSSGSSDSSSSVVLSGHELAAHLLASTRMASPHQLCCAVSFWAGYLAQLQQLGAWSTGVSCLLQAGGAALPASTPQPRPAAVP